MIGDRTAMVGAVDRAHRAYESTRGRGPAYLAHFSRAQLDGLTGLAFMRIGDHGEAATYLQSVAGGSVAYPREEIAWQIRRAQNSVRAGAISDACEVLIDNFAGISKVASTRLQTTAADIANELRGHAAVPEVRAFFGLWTAR
ncbi:hypothetical protein [Nocardia sp. NPDC057227]|uniref:hypothetical protein n=1 Tax=Nocardia sp. NPDC057227 TaxID=3346056 RepID=UPI003640F18A